jgi:hypothetical protein
MMISWHDPCLNVNVPQNFHLKSPVMSKLTSVIATMVLATLFSGAANAGLIGVKSIEVTKTAGSTQWIQVSEFQAFQTTTGNNAALATAGAVATAGDSWDGSSPASKAIDGFFSNLTFPNMFHNGYGSNALNIVLANATELSNVTIYGRSDCCSNRDIFDIKFYGVNKELLFTKTGADATNSLHKVDFALPNTAVPEPTSLALFGFGLMGLASLRRKNARAQA